MKLFSVEAMRTIDKETLESGISGVTLMGRAARGMVEEICFLCDGQPRPVILLVGPGNNGGDGFAMAGLFSRLDWPVEVWSAIEQDAVRGDALVYFKEAERSGVPIRWMPSESDWEHADIHLLPGALMVDALLGTGAQSEPRKAVGAAVKFLRHHRYHFPVISVDIPTGLNADTGEAFSSSCCVYADITLTLGGLKQGFEQDGSTLWAGSVSVVDLAFDEDLLNRHQTSDWKIFSRRDVPATLPIRIPGSHKGTMGHVLLIGGSMGMSGSISMSAQAALATGSGLVTVFTPNTCATAVDVSGLEIMVHSARVGQFGGLNDQHLPWAGINGALIGPGMRADYDTADLMQRVTEECKLPLVMDADALAHLRGFSSRFMHSDGDRYLTPHPGEMGRMIKRSASEVQSDRHRALTEAHEQSGGWQVVLKGSRSRMITASGTRWLNVNGNPGMATAGTGDVLAGMVVSLAAQGVDPERVLPMAAYLHGKAGDLAMMRKGQAGMTASDVLDAIPTALRFVQGR